MYNLTVKLETLEQESVWDRNDNNIKMEKRNKVWGCVPDLCGSANSLVAGLFAFIELGGSGFYSFSD